jgi:hypothetical protein
VLCWLGHRRFARHWAVPQLRAALQDTYQIRLSDDALTSYLGHYPTMLAAQSMKTFFGPDKPYIQGCINAYEELLEAWGGIPDHLQADFGRWLRQSDEEHKKLAREVGVSLDSGPGAARAAFAQLDSTTLADRGVIIAGNPASCIKTCQMYDAIGVDQVMLIMQTETIPHDKVMGSIEKFGKEVIPAFQSTKASPRAAATV